jgi:serine protein kinase
VIEKKMFSNTEDLLPVISFNAKASPTTEEARGLRRRMIDKGYTEKQVRLLSEWYLRVRKSPERALAGSGGDHDAAP